MTQPHHAHLSATRGAFPAVAKQEVAAAGGAEFALEDVFRTEAGAQELGAIGFRQVEQDIFRPRLVARRHHVEPLDGIRLVAGAEFLEPFWGIGKLRLKLSGDLGAHFVAAAPDRGADGGEEIGGPRAELHLHLADGFRDDTLEGAAPSGMNGGYGASSGVDEKNRDAVGGLYGQQEAGTVCGGGITPARFKGSSVDEMDQIGMDLLERNEPEVRRAEGELEAAAVLQCMFSTVPFRETEIQDLPATHGADTAGASAKTMDQPG